MKAIVSNTTQVEKPNYYELFTKIIDNIKNIVEKPESDKVKMLSDLENSPYKDTVHLVLFCESNISQNLKQKPINLKVILIAIRMAIIQGNVEVIKKGIEALLPEFNEKQYELFFNIFMEISNYFYLANQFEAGKSFITQTEKFLKDDNLTEDQKNIIEFEIKLFNSKIFSKINICEEKKPKVNSVDVSNSNITKTSNRGRKKKDNNKKVIQSNKFKIKEPIVRKTIVAELNYPLLLAIGQLREGKNEEAKTLLKYFSISIQEKGFLKKIESSLPVQASDISNLLKLINNSNDEDLNKLYEYLTKHYNILNNESLNLNDDSDLTDEEPSKAENDDIIILNDEVINESPNIVVSESNSSNEQDVTFILCKTNEEFLIPEIQYDIENQDFDTIKTQKFDDKLYEIFHNSYDSYLRKNSYEINKHISNLNDYILALEQNKGFEKVIKIFNDTFLNKNSKFFISANDDLDNDFVFELTRLAQLNVFKKLSTILLELTIEILKKQGNDRYLELLPNLAVEYYNLNELNRAEAFFIECIGNVQADVKDNVFLHLGKIAFRRLQVSKSPEYLKQAFEYLKKISNNSVYFSIAIEKQKELFNYALENNIGDAKTNAIYLLDVLYSTPISGNNQECDVILQMAKLTFYYLKDEKLFEEHCNLLIDKGYKFNSNVYDFFQKVFYNGCGNKFLELKRTDLFNKIIKLNTRTNVKQLKNNLSDYLYFYVLNPELKFENQVKIVSIISYQLIKLLDDAITGKFDIDSYKILYGFKLKLLILSRDYKALLKEFTQLNQPTAKFLEEAHQNVFIHGANLLLEFTQCNFLDALELRAFLPDLQIFTNKNFPDIYKKFVLEKFDSKYEELKYLINILADIHKKKYFDKNNKNYVEFKPLIENIPIDNIIDLTQENSIFAAF